MWLGFKNFLREPAVKMERTSMTPSRLIKPEIAKSSQTEPAWSILFYGRSAQRRRAANEFDEEGAILISA
jgi:hypothetical protein